MSRRGAASLKSVAVTLGRDDRYACTVDACTVDMGAAILSNDLSNRALPPCNHWVDTRNHNPRVGGSSPSSGIAKVLHIDLFRGDQVGDPA